MDTNLENKADAIIFPSNIPLLVTSPDLIYAALRCHESTLPPYLSAARFLRIADLNFSCKNFA